MKKFLIAFLFFFSGVAAFSQDKTLVNNGSTNQLWHHYGGVVGDSVMSPIVGSGAPTINMLNYLAIKRVSNLYNDTTSKTLYYYNPIDNTWTSLGAGGGGNIVDSLEATLDAGSYLLHSHTINIIDTDLNVNLTTNNIYSPFNFNTYTEHFSSGWDATFLNSDSGLLAQTGIGGWLDYAYSFMFAGGPLRTNNFTLSTLDGTQYYEFGSIKDGIRYAYSDQSQWTDSTLITKGYADSLAGTLVDTWSAGTTGLTPSSPTSGDVVLGGVLNIASGGTNNGSLSVTAGNLFYGDGTKFVALSTGTAGQSLHPNGSNGYVWRDTATVASQLTVGPFNNTSTANAVDITGSVFTAHAADGTNPGDISVTTQTLGAGTKTFSDMVAYGVQTWSASTITFDNSATDWIFTGTVNTVATLPAISGSTGWHYNVKNRNTTGKITVTLTAAGADNLYLYSAVATLVLDPGQEFDLKNDGTHWVVNSAPWLRGQFNGVTTSRNIVHPFGLTDTLAIGNNNILKALVNVTGTSWFYSYMGIGSTGLSSDHLLYINDASRSIQAVATIPASSSLHGLGIVDVVLAATGTGTTADVDDYIGIRSFMSNQAGGSSTQTAHAYRAFLASLGGKSDAATPITQGFGYDFELGHQLSNTQVYTTVWEYRGNPSNDGFGIVGSTIHGFYFDSLLSTYHNKAGVVVYGFHQVRNTLFDSVINVFGSRTSVGTNSDPTAILTLGAGAAAANRGPLKFTIGTNLTTAEAGTVEYDGKDLFFTPTGTIRKVIPTVIASRSNAQTAAVGTVATQTVGASDASFVVSANVLVTTSSAEAFTVTCAYTDEGNTARTLTLPFAVLAGTTVAAINFSNGAVPYEGVPVHIRCKASTTITIATTGTFTGATYNVEGAIEKIQ